MLSAAVNSTRIVEWWISTQCSAKHFAGCKKILNCLCILNEVIAKDGCVCEVQVLIFIFKYFFVCKNSIASPHKLLIILHLLQFLCFLEVKTFSHKIFPQDNRPNFSLDLKQTQNMKRLVVRYLMQTTHLCWWIYIFLFLFPWLTLPFRFGSDGRTKGENFWMRKPIYGCEA